MTTEYIFWVRLYSLMLNLTAVHSTLSQGYFYTLIPPVLELHLSCQTFVCVSRQRVHNIGKKLAWASSTYSTRFARRLHTPSVLLITLAR